MERIDDIEVSVKVLVKLSGLTARRIQQLVNEEGLAGKSKTRGKYWLGEFLAALLKYREQNEKSSDQKSAKDRQEEIKAKTAELNYMERIKELLPRKLILETITSELKEIAANIYAIPKKNSIKLLQAQNRTEVEAILDESIIAAFNKYSEHIEPPKRRKPNTARGAKRKPAPVKKTGKARTKTKTKTSNKRVGRKV